MLHSLLLAQIDEWPNVGGRCEWIADQEIGGRRNESIRKLVVQRCVHQNARRRRAGFALIVEHTLDRNGDRVAEVRVVEHNKCILSAELERGVREILRRALHHFATGRGSPGKGNAFDAWM